MRDHSTKTGIISGAIAALMLLFAAPPSFAQTTAALDAADVSAFVGGLVRGELAANRIPGASVAITQGDRVVLLQGYGFTDIAQNRRVDAERTLFRVASVSKPLIWTSVLQMRDRGLVDLDQDVNFYLDFRIPDTFPGRPITLRHLMTHSAGFEDFNISSSVRTAEERVSLGETVARMLPRRVVAPGQRTAYSNYGTALAGYIVERVSGTPLTDYLDANVFGPLGMTRTTMLQPLPEAYAADLATGYTINNGQIIAGGFEYMNLYPNGAMSTTAADMARFAIAHTGATQDTRFLTPQSWTEMHTRQFGNIPQASGLTFGFEQSRWNGHLAFGHNGNIANYVTNFVMFPESGVSIFIAFNSDSVGNAGSEIIDAFADRYLPGADDFLFDAAPVENATDNIEGAFVSSRRNASTIEKLFWPMATGVNITRVSETNIDVQFFGRQRRYVREAAGVYVPAAIELGGSDSFGAIIARTSAETGQTEIFFSAIGSFMYERPGPLEALSLHGLVLAGAFGAMVIGAILALFGTFGFKSRRSVAIVIACGLAAIAAVTTAAFAPLLVGYFTPELVYGAPSGMRALFWLPLIGGALALASVAFAIMGWRKYRPHLVQIGSVVLVSIGIGVFLWQLSVWNMLGFSGLPA